LLLELSTYCSVSNATLNRFFSLHFLLPFLLAALVAAHMMALHFHGFKGPKLNYSINYKRYKFTINNKLAFILPNFKAKNRIGPHNEEIISILVGSLLGDCYGERLLNGGVRFKFKQSIIHKDYLFYLHKKILNLGYTNNILPYLIKQNLNNKIFESYCFNTYSFTSLLWLYKLFFKNKLKIIPNYTNLYELLTPLALAIWIQDDGTWKDVSIRIATNSFKLNEIENLKNVLETKFKIKSSIFTKSNQYQLYIKKESIYLIRNLTISFFHESMLYKLGYKNN